MAQEEDFISSYLAYSAENEVPNTFTRWALLSGIGASLSKNFYFKHGHFRINPNMYVMFIGDPGTKKSTAIKLIKKLLKDSGYNHFAPNKTSKEKFLAKLAEKVTQDPNTLVDDFLDQQIFGSTADNLVGKGPIECFIAADEFNNFLGNGNMEFISLLGELWDHEGVYENELKNSKSDFIPDPIISILSGNTQTNFNLAFPPDALGQGFFSRLLFIYCDTLRDKVTFPPEPEEEKTIALISHLQAIRARVIGRAEVTPEAYKAIDHIYKNWKGVNDPRFATYSNRRFSHLIKLCLILAASNLRTTVDYRDVLYANTILSHAEIFMPKALGEFGQAKNASVTHKVLDVIERAEGIIDFKTIYKQVSNDIDKPAQLAEIIMKLKEAEKIQVVLDGKGFLPKKAIVQSGPEVLVDYSLLTAEERGMKV